MSRFQFTLATPADDSDLRHVLLSTPMDGRIRIAFAREPSYFAAAAVDGKQVQVGICRDTTTGCVVGMGSRAISPRYVDGQSRPVGYLSGLRLLPEFRGRGQLLPRGYRFLRELHADGETDFYLTTIADDNFAAMELLTSERAGLPRYHPWRRYYTLAIAAKRRPWMRRLQAAGVRCRTATMEDRDTILEFLQRHGPSAAFARDLRRTLGDVEIQTKGLLATEAFVSIPRLSQPAPALAIRSHFFEFQAVDAVEYTSRDRLLLAHELEPAREYRVVVTTAGGLYRYQLLDQVAVVGFENEAPLLRFVGKADATCDLVGEKLNAAHVQSTLQRAFDEFQRQPTFAVLTADPIPPARYVLRMVDPLLACHPAALAKLQAAIERGLSKNPGYCYARLTGQLNPLRIELLNDESAATILSEYMAERIAAGQRLGDVKPPSLVFPGMRTAESNEAISSGILSM